MSVAVESNAAANSCRKDMIDDALLRPGRLEVPVEIGLPKESGRLQILKIHTTKMKENDKMGNDVDLIELSKMTKNFSGAEIEGLVRAAQSCALNRDTRCRNCHNFFTLISMWNL